ncbi:putative efflux protein, MATE family [Desulfonispora thiosulfatigenes DSM 11270]|uniref:Multidrug export protein MepA n=1 Tax=Desulfonispora thiosulfatigenes DSM 11270 TaxID=656914 RepID=A0A1W1UFP1_DESTI|nr:MATE family efflux transporter [Desulfonispora thiosulfatigenes]SMB79849.1 putative efflux protein, MATE family [Desulfonispora thiosulfatigenes DSM 11270]
MNTKLGQEKISKLLWELSIPAILGMMSSAIFNIADRYFVGKIDPLALSGVGITMPIQMLQMAIILLIGIGSATLVSIKLGEDKQEEAESILFLSFKYIIISMIAFATIFVLFCDQILVAVSVSDAVYMYAKPYILIIIVGSIIGIPGYCLNNSLRAIGKANITMKAILWSSILNIVLDPIFIFTLKMGIAGAAIATVISQTALTLYITYYFVTNKELLINLKYKKVINELKIIKRISMIGSPSFFTQILASFVNVFVNTNAVHYGSDLDVAAMTIISTIFSFYHMFVIGLAQGNQPIIGYNWGSKQYHRVRESLIRSLVYSTIMSVALFLIIQIYPSLLVTIFTDDDSLRSTAVVGMRLYFLMIPLIGIQTISSQYFQGIGNPKLSTILMMLRYGIIILPSVLILAPIIGVKGIYLSNAISDGIASVIAMLFIIREIRSLSKLEKMQQEDAQ